MASTNKSERICDALGLEATGATIPRRGSSPISSPVEIRRKRQGDKKRSSVPCLITPGTHNYLTVQSARGVGWRPRSDITLPPRLHDITMPRSPKHTDNRNQSLSVLSEISPRSPGRNRRRCSASAILEPIHEGLPANRRNSTPAALLKRCISEELSEFQEDEYPKDLSPDFLRSRRRRSLPEIPTFRSSSPTVVIESLYPTPRKNSLVSSTLGELVSQYELLSVRERVPEENEEVTNNLTNNNNNNDIVSNLSSSA